MNYMKANIGLNVGIVTAWVTRTMIVVRIHAAAKTQKIMFRVKSARVKADGMRRFKCTN